MIQYWESPQFPNDAGQIWVVRSDFDDLEQELDSNSDIADTLGHLPSPTNNNVTCGVNAGDWTTTVSFLSHRWKWKLIVRFTVHESHLALLLDANYV